MMPLGMGMGPRDRRDMPTMKRSNQHHASRTKRRQRLHAMLTASSTVKRAMKMWSERSKRPASWVGLPLSSCMLGLSCDCAMPSAKFCRDARESARRGNGDAPKGGNAERMCRKC